MRIAIHALILALLAGCATRSPEATPTIQGIAYVDLTDDFAAAYDASAGLPEAERAIAVKQAMQAAIPDFYSANWRNVSEERVDQWFAKYLPSYPAQRGGIAEVAARFDAMMAPGLRDFERRIGPLPKDTPVYLIVSMGEFDGATRTLAGQTYLLFGADMVASLHKDNDPRPLVQHELFHIYHNERFDDCDQVWCSLWTEGLATHVAQSLNPAATDSELLLTVPEPIRPQLEAHRGEAVCAVLERLDSTEGSDKQAFFSFARLSENLPPRFGYLLGAWVAADLGRTWSLTELAELKGPDLRNAIEASLRGMADCP